MAVTQRDYLRHFRDMQLGKIHPDQSGVWTVRHYNGDDGTGANQLRVKLISPTQQTLERAKSKMKRPVQHTDQCAVKKQKLPAQGNKKREIKTNRKQGKPANKMSRKKVTKKKTSRKVEQVKTKDKHRKQQSARRHRTTKYLGRTRQL